MDESLSLFTPRAQQVLALARKEADRFYHNFVGTEHVLLGLIKFGQGTAVNVIQRMGLDLETVRTEIEQQIGPGPDQKMLGYIPYTPRVKKVLALARKEAKALNHTYVGTEHILLGLLREGNGVAARVLKNLQVDIEQTRQEILKELDPNFSASEAEGESAASGFRGSNRLRVTPPRDQDSLSSENDVVDTSKRYDVYCAERGQELLVYRDIRFKAVKRLLPGRITDSLSEFIALEFAEGRTVFVARATVVKFCEHTPTTADESTSSPFPPET